MTSYIIEAMLSLTPATRGSSTNINSSWRQELSCPHRRYAGRRARPSEQLQPGRVWGLFCGLMHSTPRRRKSPMVLGDRFEGQIYYLEAMDLFHLLDKFAEPTPNCLVAVDRLQTGQLVIERYKGQRYIGVVRAFKKYQLRQPGRQTRNDRIRCPD